MTSGEEKTVCITGVGKGIGLALLEKFLSNEWFVIGTHCNSAPNQKENLVSFPLDLSSSESVSECVGKISQIGRKISVLINNAGVLLDEDDKELVPDKLRNTLEVNIVGTADFTEKILPMISSDGHIINISSTAGSLELAGEDLSHNPGHYPAYKISKAALNMYTRTLAKRLSESEIIVSSVHPGWVKTEMGGEEADIYPEEAAGAIYKFALTRPETGGFWFNGERLPW